MDGVRSGGEKGEEQYQDELIGVSVDSKESGFYSNDVASPDESGNPFITGISSSFPPDSRIQQAFVVGNKVISSASKYNPLKDISSMQQLSTRLRKVRFIIWEPGVCVALMLSWAGSCWMFRSKGILQTRV